MDAKKLQGKGKSGKAEKALAKIQKLYGIESRLKGASVETRKAERQQHAKPILDELYEWMTTQQVIACLLYTSPSPRDGLLSRMPSSA